MPDLPDVGPGTVIDATFFQAVIAFVRANAVKVMPGGGLRTQSTGGSTAIFTDKKPAFWAKLTTNSGAGVYLFTREIDAASGAFTDDSTMTGTATEVNLTSTLTTGTIVWMRQATTTATWRFSKGAC